LKNKNRIKGSFGCRFVCLLQSRRLNSVAKALTNSDTWPFGYKDTQIGTGQSAAVGLDTNWHLVGMQA